MVTIAATALIAAASFAATMQGASASDEWCLGGATVGANRCEYATKEQCQAAAGYYGSVCSHNPFPAKASPGNAYAEFLACQSMKLDCSAYASIRRTRPRK